MKVEIRIVTQSKPGELLATVSERGNVTPKIEQTEDIQQHVARVRRLERLKGKAFLERIQRSYTNGYIVAEIVK